MLLVFVWLCCLLGRVDYASGQSFEHCGTRHEEEQGPSSIAFIADGKAVDKNELPWMVSVRLGGSEGFEHVCGGTLIQTNVVLTAAHCLFERVYSGAKMIRRRYSENAFEVVTGGHWLNGTVKGEQVHRVRRLIVHPGFDQTNDDRFEHDIALVLLKSHVKVASSSVQPACVGDRAFDKQVLEGPSRRFAQCHVAGWGNDPYDRTGAHLSNRLLYRQVPVLNESICELFWSKDEFDAATMLCAGKSSKGLSAAGPCGGDSGGPLVCTTDSRVFYVMGVISWGHTFCMRKPAVFIRTSAYYDWMRQQLNRQGIRWPLTPTPEPKQAPLPARARPLDRPLPTTSVGRGRLTDRPCKLDMYQMRRYHHIVGHDLLRVTVKSFHECLQACCNSIACQAANLNLVTKECSLVAINVCQATRLELRPMGKLSVVFSKSCDAQ